MKTRKMEYRGMPKTGFTLVELAVTIVIIIVLSSISVPIYRSFINDAKIAEAYALLGTIREAQKNYYALYGNFLYTSESSIKKNYFSCNEDVLGIDARGNKYFTSFLPFHNNGYFAGNTKYYFDAEVQNSSVGTFFLQYNITLGQKIYEIKPGSPGRDSSWA